MEALQLFNPGNQTEQALRQSFSIRKKEFERISKIIINDKMNNPPQHFIIQGVRGSGKTTLLLRTYYEIRSNKQLSSWLIPIIFNEELYSVNRLFKFWEKIASELEQESDKYCGLFDKMQESDEIENYEEQCYETLFDALKRNKNKICLFVDNIGDFLQKLTRKEQQRFREVLITNNSIRIVGSSAVVLESTYKYDEPFYEFFKIIQLQDLKSEETREFLLELDRLNHTNRIQTIIKENPGRIEALRIITGGVPRTIVLLYEIFINDSNGDSFKYLEVLLDRVTPLYKHRMDELSSQQQEIMDCIALNWDAIAVKEIARITRMESKAVSSQLRLLEKNNVVIKKTTSTKNHLYQVKERFFNIWYIMRNGRKSDKNKVKWLTKFLELWCDKNSLDDMVNEHIAKLKREKVYDKYAYSLSEAYACMVPSPEKQHKLLTETKAYLDSTKSDLANELSKSDLDFISNDIAPLIERKEYEKALNNLKRKDSNTGQLENTIAFVYDKFLKDNLSAEKYYLKAVVKGNVESMILLGLLYDDEFKDFNKAEVYYLKAVEKGDVRAMWNLALLYGNELNDFTRAEKYYLLAAEKENVGSMFNLALLYKDKLKDFTMAEKYYLMAVEYGDRQAMFNLASLYHLEFNDFGKAEKYYLMASDKGDEGAMNNLATLYENEFKDFGKAEKYYLMAVEKGNIDAMHNLAFLYLVQCSNKEMAEQLSEKAFNSDKSFLRIGTNYSLILLWNNKIDTALEISAPLFQNKTLIKEHTKNTELLINMLIAKKQYSFVYRIFEENSCQIKDRLKPVYYALMHFVQDKYPDEIKKMGEELNETVDGIVQYILALREKYE
jgi:TPR repeat protein